MHFLHESVIWCKCRKDNLTGKNRTRKKYLFLGLSKKQYYQYLKILVIYNFLRSSSMDKKVFFNELLNQIIWQNCRKSCLVYMIHISCFIYFIYIYADHAAGVINNIMSKNSMKLCLFVILFEKILGKSEQIL